MTSVPLRGYRFGVYELDTHDGELRKRGIRIRLQTQPMRVLIMLLAKAGELVTREEIQQALWPGETFVDFEHGLNSAVNKIRSALGDSAANPMFLDTVPRQGYRFIAPVEPVFAQPAPLPAAPAGPTNPQPPARPPAAPAVPPWGAPAANSGAETLFKVLMALAIAGVAVFFLLAVVPRLNTNRQAATPGAAPAEWGVRILAGQSDPRLDGANALWEADRYFIGGLSANRDRWIQGTDDNALFAGERYGNFEYMIPVPPGSYRVVLYFAETWFGPGNPGGGGTGSRRFDVIINRDAALEDFEPFAQAGGANRAVVRSFDGVEPSADGFITIRFTPTIQNAMVNAIEIEAASADTSGARP